MTGQKSQISCLDRISGGARSVGFEINIKTMEFNGKRYGTPVKGKINSITKSKISAILDGDYFLLDLDSGFLEIEGSKAGRASLICDEELK